MTFKQTIIVPSTARQGDYRIEATYCNSDFVERSNPLEVQVFICGMPFALREMPHGYIPDFLSSVKEFRELMDDSLRTQIGRVMVHSKIMAAREAATEFHQIGGVGIALRQKNHEELQKVNKIMEDVRHKANLVKHLMIMTHSVNSIRWINATDI